MSESKAILASIRFAAATAVKQGRPEEAAVLWATVQWVTASIEKMRADAGELKTLRERLGKWEPLSDAQLFGGQCPNPIDHMAAKRGWSPLSPGKSMDISYSGIEYRVERLDQTEESES